MIWSTFALMIAYIALMIGLAAAQGIEVPGDDNGDKIVSADEVAAAEKLAQEGKLSADELKEIRHIHEKYPITIIDSDNRTVTIYKPIKRMICQTTWGYEPIFILGGTDRISAVEYDAQRIYGFVPGLQKLPTIGKARAPDWEKIVENQPDVFVMSNNKTLADFEKKLDLLGSAIVILRFSEINKFQKEFRTLAKLLEKDDKAEEYLSWWQGYLNQIYEKTTKIEHKVRVYNEGSDSPWHTGSKMSAISNVITLAGGFNIASTINTKSAEVSPEWVMLQNPNVIIIPAFFDLAPTDLTGYHLNSTENARIFIEEASSRTGWKETDAVKNKKVYVLDGVIGYSACNGAVGVCYCAKWFYPEAFKDLDPDAINREYFEKWLGVPYKGIWGYPSAG